MSADELSFLSIVEAAAGLRSKRFSAMDLTNACLARVESIDSKLHSFITLTAGLARERARQADEELRAGTDRGALHGIPIAFKDLYLTKGIRTTCHSAVLQIWFPEYDATATVKLTEAGAILLGKLGMHEFAFGGPSVDAPFPAVKNPWNTAHVTGGSSSGSGAALAAGFCYGALGSDTGGSIRNPAAHCGVVGIKPTYGRVSRYGVVPLSWSLDHAGPMARCVQDCAIMLQALAGFDGKDAASARIAVPEFRASLYQGIRGLRIGLPRANWFDENLGVAPETEGVFNEAVKKLHQLGADVIDIDGQPFSLARKANQTILVGEAYAYHEKTFQTMPEKFGSSVRRRMLEGAFLSAADYITAQRARAVLNQQMLENFARVDVLVTPTIARPPDAFDTLDPNEQNLRPNFTNPFNLAGLPAISVPCGFTDGPLPVGMQIVAPAFEEATCFRVAYAYEQATDWHIRRPSV
ncbi:MAG TPA: amidase [Candidatus Binatia bacterium]|nr:amidase [Candidatus Binatia bacterium]